jgi:hypothetical protein
MFIRLEEQMRTPALLAILGVIAVGIEIAAAVSNKWAHETSSNWRQRSLSWLAIVLGGVLALASFRTGIYPLGEHTRVAGVPFMIVILKFERGHWIDYVSVLAPLAMFGNVIFAVLLPQVLVFLSRKIGWTVSK